MQDTPKNFYKKFLGRQGELKAKKFLQKKGYKIIETNYTTKYGEVDLIGLYGDFLVFIEVKNRTTKTFGEPVEAVDFKKQKHYRKVATYFVMTHPEITLQPRFDVVEVFNDQINHIEDAFQ